MEQRVASTGDTFKKQGLGKVFAAAASLVLGLTSCGGGITITVGTSNPPQTGATRFNIQDSSLLYTTSEAIAISQLQSAQGAALMAGLQAGIASSAAPRNSSAFNLVAVGNDGISRQAIESQYFNRVLYTALPPAFNSLTGKTLTDKNVYIAFSSESLPNDSNDYSEFIRLNQPDQPCAFYRVNLSSNSHECVLPGVEPMPYFDTDFGKIEGNGRKPIQFDAQGNVYLVGKPFSVVNNKVSKASYAVLYKIDSKTLSASPLTQNNESVSFFSVLSSGEPVIALSTGTGYNLILFTKTGARRTLESGVSDPFVTLDSYRSVLYGNASPGSSGIKAFRTNDQEKLEQVALDYSPNANANANADSNATGSRYSLQTGGKTYTNPIPRRIIFGDDGKFYTVYSATPTAAANGAAALLIYQTLPFAKDPVAAIPLTGADWWTWMKNRTLQIKRGTLYYPEQINRDGVGLVDAIRLVRLSDSATQTLFADRAYTIHSWRALGDTLAFSGMDNDKNQLVQGQVDTLAIARQADWSPAEWARFNPVTVNASATASKGTVTVQDLESLLPPPPQAGTGLEPAILAFESTEKSALISFSQYIDKPSVQSLLQIQSKNAGVAAPQTFHVWGHQNLFLVYDTSSQGLADAVTSGLPAGGGNRFEISNTGNLPDVYKRYTTQKLSYLISEKPDGSYALTTPQHLTINSQPTGLTVNAGQSVSFTVVASGTGTLSYQWKRNGRDIAGAMQSSYSFAAASADDDTLFAVAVSNASGTQLSSNAQLWVLSVPAIATQPAARTVNQGQTASFSVVATGTGPLRYQWKKNDSDISGATSSAYTTPATGVADSGAVFSVRVSNAIGNVSSNSASLSVNVAPSVATQPASQTVTEGQTATFQVTASGTAPLAYQWKKNGSDISGATASTYTTPVTTGADSGTAYSVAVSNSAGTVTSSNATLTVNVRPSISSQPASQTVVEGQTASLGVVASGSGTLSYQWRKNGSHISGATASTYTTPATVLADSGAVFSVQVSNAIGSVTSSTATVTVNPVVAPAITAQPGSQSVTVGQTATFSVSASSNAPVSYQWSKNGSNIAGANASSYTTPVTTVADTGTAYSVTVSNSAGTVTSNSATLTVNITPSIGTQPASQTVATGQTASFGVTAFGGTLSYQWKKNGSDISGATASTYTTPAAVIGDNAAVFTVVVTNSAGTVTSNSATLTVEAVRIGTQPLTQTVAPGIAARFSVTATGAGPLTYQWKKNNTNIVGATASTYTTPLTTSADNGAVFSVVVSNSSGSATSSTATLTVAQYSLVAKTGGFYDITECVKDNGTGLIWEGKTASGDRSGTDHYSNYDSTSSAQKTGLGGSVYINPTQEDIDNSVNGIGYKNAVNASALCGYTDWRLPTEFELRGLLASSGNPRIDTTWFPNTGASWYWSSTPNSLYSFSAYIVHFRNGYLSTGIRGSYYRVRLVR